MEAEGIHGEGQRGKSRWPRITLVVPALNQGEYLADCLGSIWAQKYPNLDLRVVDAGSTDGSVEFLRENAARISYWCSEPDGGHYRGVEKGFAGSEGEVMGWLNGDDLLMPGALQAVGGMFAEHRELEWLSTMTPMFLDASGVLQGAGMIRGFSRDAFLEGLNLPPGAATSIPIGGARHSVQQESTFWRRSLWEKSGAGIDKEFPLAGDFALWARFYRHAELVGTPVPLGAFRFRRGQRSEALAEYVSEAERALELCRADLGWNSRMRRRRMVYDYLGRLPGVGKRLKAKLEFDGTEIRKLSPGEPECGWSIRRFRFREP